MLNSNKFYMNMGLFQLVYMQISHSIIIQVESSLDAQVMLANIASTMLFY